MRNACIAWLILSSSFLWADDWPMLGRDSTHNAVSREKAAPVDFQPELKDYRTGKIMKEARNIKWTAQLGARVVSSPAVADGLVWIGTNNQYPRDAEQKADASVLMCFRESDGKFLYQYLSPRLDAPPQDYWHHAMGSTPLIEKSQLWLLNNRSEVVCLDIGPLHSGVGTPREVWKVDLRKEFGVYPHAPMMAAGFNPSIVSYRDLLYVVTGNGVDENHAKLPSPEAPSLVCLNKHTGKTVWKDASPGKDIFHCQRSSPLVVERDGKAQVIVGQGDGWLRSFEVKTGKLIWKFDLNPKHYPKYDLGGNGKRSYVMAAPVLYQDRVYIATGQDPEHYEGVGHLWCIDVPKATTAGGDVSTELVSDDHAKPVKTKPNPNSAAVWTIGGMYSKEDAKKFDRDYSFGRTQSNVVIRDGLVYAAELAGYLHCFDAASGRAYWSHDLKASVWGSSLWADGKIYVPTEDGELYIYFHGKEFKEPRKIEFGKVLHGTPIFANGVLYVPAESRLYAIQEKK